MSNHALLADYVRSMCAPVLSGDQDANLMFVPEDQLSAILPIVEQLDVQSQVHEQSEGIAAIYLYRRDDVASELLQLSSLSVEQPDYYYRTGSMLGYHQAVIQECVQSHPEAFTQEMADHP